MSDIIRLDAATLADKIARRELSSVEVTRACLDQIEATDDQYRAFLHVAADQALADAARVDAAVAAGEDVAPLAGVPLALKDVFTTTDMPTTCGSRILEGWHPPYDATVTLRQRGGTGRVPGAAGDRLRYRGVDPAASSADRDRRRQTDLRHGVALRTGGLRVVAGPGRTVCTHGARHRAAARGDRRARRERLHLHRRRGS